MTAPGPADIIGLLLLTGLAAFWIWAVIDSTRRQRYGWTAAIVLLPALGAVLYYARGREPRPGEFLH
jgi:hypothetical protein